MCTYLADLSFSCSSDLEVVGFELKEVEVSFEVDFCWMVIGAWKPDYRPISLTLRYEQHFTDLVVFLGHKSWVRVSRVDQELAEQGSFLSFTKRISQLTYYTSNQVMA